MSSLSLKLDGEPGTVALSAFASAVDEWLQVLRDLDAGISGIATGSLDWLVTDLRTGSLVVEAAWRSRIEERNFGPEVERYAIAGLNSLEAEGLTPPYLTEIGIGHLRKLTKLIGTQGVTGIEVGNHIDNALLSAKSSANIEQLLPARSFSMGSVQGRLEVINLHGKPRFTVYHHITRKGVTCRFQPDHIDLVKQALGNRVVISGTVHYNAKLEPVRVDLESIHSVKSEAELPRTAQLTGRLPDFTGELTTAEYLGVVRGS